MAGNGLAKSTLVAKKENLADVLGCFRKTIASQSRNFIHNDLY